MLEYKRLLRANRITVTINCVFGTVLLFSSVAVSHVFFKSAMLGAAIFTGILSGFLLWLNRDLAAQENLEKQFVKDTQAMSTASRASLEAERQRLETAQKLEDLLKKNT